ncbi:MAG: acyl-CoA thioesterase [Caldilineaceae bacterium SB0661_bin_32]|uniref:Acyl-CoA thioesterase n=1 Tax=Caldilineaceae bacterium SB0661_bin_32 TaxID=2605255 RepID=A0A6B1D8E2_9CHLR|nr:acyl-CoA thioesterase [Caldilineaceae bacterium SB0661_bin_32]
MPMDKTEYAAFPLDITVRFAETDQMGVVHHSEYVVWFEAGRVAWMAAAGMPYTEIAGAGYNFAVTDLQCRYRNAIRFGDAVQVITRLGSLRSRQVEFVYEIRNPHTGDIYADGHTRHICVDGDGRMTRVPDWIAQRLLGKVEGEAYSENA